MDLEFYWTWLEKYKKIKKVILEAGVHDEQSTVVWVVDILYMSVSLCDSKTNVIIYHFV